MKHIRIDVDGNKLDSVETFIARFCQQCVICDQVTITSLTQLSACVLEKDLSITLRWHNSTESKALMVRKSDIPLDELPKGGSNMMRDIILALVYDQISLYEKVCRSFTDNANVTIETR